MMNAKILQFPSCGESRGRIDVLLLDWLLGSLCTLLSILGAGLIALGMLLVFLAAARPAQ